MDQSAKPFYLSKTLWLQIFGIVAIVVPASAAFIQANLGAAGSIWIVANALLRLISKDKLEIS